MEDQRRRFAFEFLEDELGCSDLVAKVSLVIFGSADPMSYHKAQ